MKVTGEGRTDGQYVEIPIKVTYRDRRDSLLRKEVEDVIQIFLPQEDIDKMKIEEKLGLRTFRESIRNDLQVLIEDMEKTNLEQFPYGYMEVNINGIVKWL